MSNYPKKLITQNTDESDQRSSGWVVAVVRYLEPSAMADSKDFPTKVTVIQNDAVSISINNPKNSFAKTCNINLKCTDIWYPSTVSPGDWVIVWMQKNQKELDRITAAVNKIKNGGTVGDTLCNEFSGLKFAGRVLSVTHNDTVSSSGLRTINQSISAQAFIEFATSVYYTAKVKGYVPGVQGGPTQSAPQGSQQAAAIQNIQIGGLDDVLGRLARKYQEAYISGKIEPSPDAIIGLYFITIMGMDKDRLAKLIESPAGSFNNGIHIPNSVARIFNRPKAKKLWEIMNLYLGIQVHTRQKPWYKGFSPKVGTVDEDVFRRTPVRCKGFIPYKPALWDNVSMWSILSQYVNQVCNEMYTALRINDNGRIIPTLTVREKPFSTGLFNVLKENTLDSGGTLGDAIPESLKPEVDDWEKKKETQQGALGDFSEFTKSLASIKGNLGSIREKITNTKVTEFEKQQKKTANTRTMYGLLPRWQISEGIVKSFTFSSNEANRINFVQVWGRSAGMEFEKPAGGLTTIITQQFNNGNFFIDQKDVSRNGLRAYITQSNYDITYGGQAQFFAPLWARMSADWLFNGHLKINGTLTTTGIVEPICEGDNLEYRGILFHIESVSHTAQISPSGQKIWSTSMSLSNGVMAKSLENPNGIPSYVTYQGKTKANEGVVKRQDYINPLVPGLNEVQTRLGDTSKNALGDAVNKFLGNKRTY